MKNSIAQIALIVKDYDEAIEFYTKKLNFILKEDTTLSDSKRWVVIAPIGSDECCILLAKGVGDRQTSCVGNQTGGRVFLFLHTDDFDNYFNYIESMGVKIIRSPHKEHYGKVAVFEDLYGNLWDLIQPEYK